MSETTVDAACKAVYADGKLFETDIAGELPLFIPPGAKGVAAMPAVTLPEMFHTTAGKYPNATAIQWRVPDDVIGPDGNENYGPAPYSYYFNLAAKAGIFNTNNTLKQLHDKRQVVIAQAREQEELAEETA